MAHTNFRNLTDEQVREITELWDDGGGCTKAELAEAYGVSVVTINRVLGRRWSSTIDQEAIDQFTGPAQDGAGQGPTDPDHRPAAGH